MSDYENLVQIRQPVPQDMVSLYELWRDIGGGRHARVVALDSAGVPAVTAGEAHIGSVSGQIGSYELEITRPANTTPYGALDTIGVSLAVSGATNASPIVITTPMHSLADGDPITISSVGGNTNANGDYFAKVTGYSTTTFALYTDKALTTPRAGNSNYTSGGAVARLFRLPDFARVAGGAGIIIKVQVITDQKTWTSGVKLHLFNAPVTAILDNDPYLMLYANAGKRVGQVIMPAAATEDATSSTAASALASIGTSGSNLPLPFKCAASERDLYFMLSLAAGYTPTPASAQKFTVRILAELY